MPSEIDLRGGKIVISEKDRRAELSKIELLSAKDSRDVAILLSSKIGRTMGQVYYFRSAFPEEGWDCISGPLGLREPLERDWPARAVKGRVS